MKPKKIRRKNRPQALVLRSSTLLWVAADGSHGCCDLALLDLSKLRPESIDNLFELLDESSDHERLGLVLDYATSLDGKVITLAGVL